MRKADILVVSGQGLESDVIKLVTNSKYSHVALAINDKQVIEATPYGVKINSLDEYRDIAYVVMRPILPLTGEQADMVVANALTYERIPFNWLEIVWAGITTLLHIKWKNPFFSTRALDCVGLVIYSYRDLYPALFPTDDPGDITPEMFVENGLLYINEGHFTDGSSVTYS